MVISDLVSVPVLSEQITDAEPRVSTDESFLTIAFSLAMRCTPSASTTDKMAGKPSGTAATASDTPNSSTVIKPCKLLTLLINNSVPITITAMPNTAMPSMCPMRPTSFCNGVSSSVAAASISAIAPICVAMPVAVTTAKPLPPATAVPL